LGTRRMYAMRHRKNPHPPLVVATLYDSAALILPLDPPRQKNHSAKKVLLASSSQKGG
jgi:hypothetical protein